MGEKNIDKEAQLVEFPRQGHVYVIEEVPVGLVGALPDGKESKVADQHCPHRDKQQDEEAVVDSVHAGHHPGKDTKQGGHVEDDAEEKGRKVN